MYKHKPIDREEREGEREVVDKTEIVHIIVSVINIIGMCNAIIAIIISIMMIILQLNEMKVDLCEHTLSRHIDLYLFSMISCVHRWNVQETIIE